MKAEKLTDIKKELSHKTVQQLSDLCLRLAKYKKDNKELLTYLLYGANDPLRYAEQVKSFLEDDFKALPKNQYYAIKSLRKILRLLTKQAKYTASKQAELELLIWFCKNYIAYADNKTVNKTLQGLFLRQVEKINKLLPRLHEDLQYDYRQELERIVYEAEKQVSWFNKRSIALYQM